MIAVNFHTVNQLSAVVENVQQLPGFMYDLLHPNASYIHDLHTFSFGNFCFALILAQGWCGLITAGQSPTKREQQKVGEIRTTLV